MRILTRKTGEGFLIGDILVKVAAIRGERVKFRVTAPQGTLVCYQEIIEELSEAAKQAQSVPLGPSAHP